MSVLVAKADRLLHLLASLNRCLVAYSGGVDSMLVAAAAQRALGSRATAVMAISPSLAQGEREAAAAAAEQIGIRFEAIETDELSRADYARNAADRCYYCKSTLYERLAILAEQQQAVIVNGANVDDQGDYRPGMHAAVERQVRSPLIECDFRKSDVRDLARSWGLPAWDKPAMPCLASRIAYGEEVSADRLKMIDLAERFLRGLGCESVRVRYHRGDMARIEVDAENLARLAEPAIRTAISAAFRSYGFQFISLDLDGFRSGSLNALVSIGSSTGE